MSETTNNREGIREGFRLRQTKLELPLDNSGLDPQLQMDLLICHLFINEARPISAITQLGEDYPTVVRALLEQGIVWERRQKPRSAKPAA